MAFQSLSRPVVAVRRPHALMRSLRCQSSSSNGAQAEQTRYPHINDNTEHLTNNQGHPIPSDDYSLKAGVRGPILLEDYSLLEKLGQFHREKVPERVVHARGMVAKGYFEVTKDITHLSRAALFSEVGQRTPVAARLSTVVHERGSPESLRDVRGFSVKFYTSEGNWDFTGNDIPVFMIRDGYQFPDVVHALRPNPKNHIQEGWRIMDYLASKPESMAFLTWLIGDEGIPKNWRTMDGFSVNTFKLINAEGKETYVKFVFRSKIGAQYMTDEDAKMVGEENMRHSHATHDLFNEIKEGRFPEWTFGIQTMEIEDEDKYDFDPLDCTKEWPESQFPFQEVGRMVLDTNITNFHNESESIAFNPGVVVPGIGISNDPVLQSRVMSYSDAQRYRLGVNYINLPVNMPKCPFHNNSYDGSMPVVQRDEEINYYPSMVAPKKDERTTKDYPYPQERIEGTRVKADVTSGRKEYTADFTQAGDRVRSFDPDRRGRFLKHVVAWLGDPKCPDQVRDVWYGHWDKADEAFGQEVRQGVQEMTGGKSGSPEVVGASKA